MAKSTLHTKMSFDFKLLNLMLFAKSDMKAQTFICKQFMK